MMVNFEELAELSFLIFVLDQVLVLDYGLVVDENNFGPYISLNYDA